MKRSIEVMEEFKIKASTEFLFFNYILLNYSFSEYIGLVYGRGACTLYFYLLKRHFYELDLSEIAFNSLDELLESINMKTPMQFGNGMAGIGNLLEYLAQKREIEEDCNELLKEIDFYLLNTIYSGTAKDISIADGISGLGLYCLNRYPSSARMGRIYALKHKEGIIACVDQISKIVNKSNYSCKDFSLLNGIGGAFLFLNWVYDLEWYKQPVHELIKKLQVLLIGYLRSNDFSFEKSEVFFILLQTKVVTKKLEVKKNLSRCLSRFISEMKRNNIELIDFNRIAFIAYPTGQVHIFRVSHEL